MIQPLRAAAQAPQATVRFETAPGQQPQVDFGQRRVWPGEMPVTAHVFVSALGFSGACSPTGFRTSAWRRCWRGMERAFQRFAGVSEQIVTPSR